MPDLVGDMGDPVKVAAAMKPLVDDFILNFPKALAHELVEAMDGLTFKLVDGGLQIVKKPTP